MTPSGGELVFNSTPFSIAVSSVFVFVVVVLAFLGWKRSGWRPGIGVLEVLRVLIAIAIALTFNQPEWHETFEPTTKPVVAVLHDASGSMETEDILDGAGEPTSRIEAAAPLTDPAMWGAIGERMDTVIEPFSSAEDPPEEGTDLNGALMRVLEQQPRLAAVVLATDGDWNTGESPALAATRLRMRGVPVVAVPVGSDTRLPDVELVSFDVPTFAVAGKAAADPVLDRFGASARGTGHRHDDDIDRRGDQPAVHAPCHGAPPGGSVMATRRPWRDRTRARGAEDWR